MSEELRTEFANGDPMYVLDVAANGGALGEIANRLLKDAPRGTDREALMADIVAIVREERDACMSVPSASEMQDAVDYQRLLESWGES